MSFDYLNQLLSQSRRYDNHKHDHVVPARELHFDDDSRLTVPLPLAPMQVSPHAYGQLFDKLGPGHFGSGSAKSLPRDYLLAFDPPMRAAVLNYHLRGANGGEWAVRGYSDECRAILDGGYPLAIRNSDYMQTLVDLVAPEIDSLADFRTAHRSSVTPDRIQLYTLWKDTGAGEGGLWAGILMRNDEIGSGRFEGLPLVWRGGCENAIVVRPQTQASASFSFAHTGLAATKIAISRAVIAEILNLSAELVGRMIEAENQRLPDLADIIGGLARQHGWSQSVERAVFLGTEGRETRAGLINGITFAAHRYDHSPEETLRLEMIGGDILVAPDSLFGRAAALGRTQRHLAEARLAN